MDYDFIYDTWKDIINLVKVSINHGYYLRVFLNKSKLKLYGTDQQIQHDVLIYGYDDKNEIVFLADHFQNGFFSMQSCTYKELIVAFDTYAVERFNINPAFLNSVQLVKKEDSLMRLRYSMYSEKEMVEAMSINTLRIKNSLCDYINAAPTCNWFSRGRMMDTVLQKSHRWGIECYEILIDYVNSICEKDVNPTFARNSFFVSYNHKVVMLKRIEVLEKYGYLDNAFLHKQRVENLIRMAKRNMLAYIKYSIKEKEIESSYAREREKIVTNIISMKNMDYLFVADLINDVKF